MHRSRAGESALVSIEPLAPLPRGDLDWFDPSAHSPIDLPGSRVIEYEGRFLSVRYWGTRGSIPTPGPYHRQYGGNTSCVEVLAGDARIILDAGTGIRPLGEELKAQKHRPEGLHLPDPLSLGSCSGIPLLCPGL